MEMLESMAVVVPGWWCMMLMVVVVARLRRLTKVVTGRYLRVSELFGGI
jgi:energy-coupling factor transporter transmembrane protein EcfT